MTLKKFNHIDIDLIKKEISMNGYHHSAVMFSSENDFLDFSYNLGQVVPPGRNSSIVTVIETTEQKGEAEVLLHNDKSYWNIPPKYLCFYIKKINTECQWDISSLKQAFDQLDSSEKDILKNNNFTFKSPLNRDDYHNELYFYNKFNDEIFFRYREDLCSIQHEILKKFRAKLYKNKINIKANQGSLIILNNWTIAHGRTLEDFVSNKMDRIAYRTLVI